MTLRAIRHIAFLILGLIAVVPAMAVSPELKPAESSHGLLLVPEKESMHLAYINTWQPTLPSVGGPVIEEETPFYVSDMISYAKEFLGLRYRRGGKTPKGFDCSGFMGYLFGQFGMKLNASSRSQYLQGEAVDDGMIRPGDLVFFSGRRGGVKTVGHVGMIVEIHSDGTFSFIHSANSSGITISNSLEPYYKSRYMGARRVTQ